MYCERCGKQIDDALNFCNSCGAQLKKEKDPAKSVLANLTSALISVAVVGLGVLVGLVAILLNKMPQPELIVVFSFIYLAVLFSICFMILRQISKVIDARVINKPSTDANVQPLVQLPPRTTAQLEEHRPPASVTEHTTRTLDHVPIDHS